MEDRRSTREVGRLKGEARGIRMAAAFRFFALLSSLFLLLGEAASLPAQTIQFLNAAPSVYENGTNVSVVVTRTPANGVATVEYTTLDGTAVAGSDYQLTTGSLTFNNGE